jgi:hypothetical protein
MGKTDKGTETTMGIAPSKVLRELEVELRTEMRPEDIRPTPKTFFGKLKALGPTFILAGAIVGSGELIATTLLGAKIGFIMLWAIIFSCLAKIMIQEVIGRYVIVTGKGLHEMLDEVPGPRLGVSWAVWWVILLMVSLTIVMAGIFGAQGLALKGLLGFGDANVLGVLAGVVGIILLYRGIYSDIEIIVVLMVISFSLGTAFLAFVGLQYTPYPVTAADFASGLNFHLPAAGVAVACRCSAARAVSEWLQYTYWAKRRCRGQSLRGRGWSAPKGWIHVMRWDLGLAAASYHGDHRFHVMGAAVLPNEYRQAGSSWSMAGPHVCRRWGRGQPPVLFVALSSSARPISSMSPGLRA